MYDAIVPRHQRVSAPLYWRTLTAFAAALVIAGCGSDGAAPTAPTAKTASVASVAVVGTALTVGAIAQFPVTAQFVATATLSDGSTQNVTTVATWASSNQDVASVTSAGIVTAKAPGDADITATYNGVSGKAHLTLVRPPALVAVISGTVTDGFSGGVLPNISVAIVDSRGATNSTRTDATGRYSVANVATGPATVSFSATSYVTLTKTVTVSADTRIDVTLERAGPISGPALLTIHAPFDYEPPLCSPSATGIDFMIRGAQTVDEQHLVFTAGPYTSVVGSVLTLGLTKTGTQLAGDIGGGANADSTFGPPFALAVNITDLANNYGHRAGANGGVGANGRTSGTMTGTLFAEHINPWFWCSGTFQWALTNQ